MDRQKAFDMINQALASVSTSRQGHIALQQALDFLMKLSEDKASKTTPKVEATNACKPG